MIRVHYYCGECGCEHVQGTAWVYRNSELGEPEADAPSDEIFCPDCDSQGGGSNVLLCWTEYDDETMTETDGSSHAGASEYAAEKEAKRMRDRGVTLEV